MIRRYTRRVGHRAAVAEIPEAPLNPKFFRNGIVMLALVVVALAVVVTLVTQSSPSSEVAYTAFLENVQQGDVKSIIQEGSKLTVTPSR